MRLKFWQFLILLFPLFSYAERATFLLMPGPLEGFTVKRQCYRAQTPVYLQEKTVTFKDPHGRYSSYVERIPTAGRSPEVNAIVDNILYDWEKIHGYTHADNIKMLRARDRSLAPLRTSYLQYQNSEDVHAPFSQIKRMGLRIYDGSDRIFRFGQEWEEASSAYNISPLEMSDPQFNYPGRTPDQDFYYWELGLLSVNPELMGGIQSAFNQVAIQLDYHYNGSDFKFFGQTSEIRERHMMIFAQTREAQIPTFRKYGLEPVLDDHGQPRKLGSGLFLIAAPASRFIELNFGYHYFASDKKNGPYYDSEAMKKLIVQRQKETLWLDQQRIENIRSLKDVSFYYADLLKLRDELILLPQNHPKREELAMIFIGSYLRLVNSIPPAFLAPGWPNPRKAILASMTAATFVDAYLHLYYLATKSNLPNTYVTPEQRETWKNNLPSLPIPKPYIDFSFSSQN